MSADIRMVDWQSAGRIYQRMMSYVDSLYVLEVTDHDQHDAEIGAIRVSEVHTSMARGRLVRRGYWDHRPQHDR